jgi:hypothetical protein
VAFARGRQGRRRASTGLGDDPHSRHRPAGPEPALRDPLHGHHGRCDRNRGIDHRRRLHRDVGASRLSPVRLAADLSDPCQYRVADRRGDDDHRHRHRDGLGNRGSRYGWSR